MTNRRQLATELGQELALEVKYLGVPSCAYQVGNYTINKDGTIDGDLEAIRDFLINHGIIHNEPITSSTDTGMTESTPLSLCDVDSIELSIPANDLTPQQLINLIYILYARQRLLAAMTRNDNIHMDEELIGLLKDEKPDTSERILELLQNEIHVGMVTGINITADVFTLTLAGADHSDDLTTYVRLMSALLARAKEAGFVSAKLIDPAEGEMKYYVNSFLNQLGFGGADHKEDRRVLMGHIKGYAAFKNNVQMEKHKARLKDRRQTAKQTAPANLEEGDAQ
ncbi:MAG: hypothetical protein II885_16905 [Oscillospiraceae bacterium]|nr:hypothetical protein [Oscillospiraceae bacterium]